MKKFLILSLVLLIAFSAEAQRKGKKSKANEATQPNATTPVELPPDPSVNVNLLPLYGGRTKTAAQQQADQAFLTDCDRNFSSREEASQFFETRAWEYLKEGKMDTAAYRFNLAWLLNEKNANTYWGLGVISSEKGQTDEAIGLLEKGLTFVPGSAPLLVDIASLRLNRYKEKNDKKDLQTSMELLNRAIQSDSTFASAYYKQSVVYFHQEDYDKAWASLHKGRSLSVAGMDFGYLTELMAKKEDPLGVFK